MGESCCNLGAGSDIFPALRIAPPPHGGTLYALLTGKSPFEAPQVGEVLARIVSEPPNSFAQHGARLPRGLEHIILRTMAKDRGKRHSSYEVLRTDLLPYSSSGLGPVAMARRCPASRQ